MPSHRRRKFEFNHEEEDGERPEGIVDDPEGVRLYEAVRAAWAELEEAEERMLERPREEISEKRRAYSDALRAWAR